MQDFYLTPTDKVTLTPSASGAERQRSLWKTGSRDGASQDCQEDTGARTLRSSLTVPDSGCWGLIMSKTNKILWGALSSTCLMHAHGLAYFKVFDVSGHF